jgi:hypothetical protein
MGRIDIQRLVHPETMLAELDGDNSATIRMTDQFGTPVINANNSQV